MNERAQLLWLDVSDCRVMASRMANWLASVPPQTRLLVLLNGTLGSGKTQLVKFLVEQLNRRRSQPSASPSGSAASTAAVQSPAPAPDPPQPPAVTATSPTFSLEHRYPTEPPLIHLDLYRIDDEDQLWELGLEETLEEPGIVLVEWANRFPSYWPRQRLSVTIELLADDRRHIELDASGELPVSCLRAISSPVEPPG
jgi:tRNA A37 threonylcarbamoyladenosine biosynthesis protein TsaE